MNSTLIIIFDFEAVILFTEVQDEGIILQQRQIEKEVSFVGVLGSKCII